MWGIALHNIGCSAPLDYHPLKAQSPLPKQKAPTKISNTLPLWGRMTSSRTSPSICVCVHAHSVAQLCPALCDPMDCSPRGSSVHGILQARILEWVAISFSRDLPNPEIEPRSPTLQADSLPSEPPGKSLLLFKYV